MKLLLDFLPIVLFFIGFKWAGANPQDAQAILDYVKSMKDAEPIFIIGRSLGGAVASYMVSLDETPFEGLILENTFTSIADMVDSIFYFVGYV